MKLSLGLFLAATFGTVIPENVFAKQNSKGGSLLPVVIVPGTGGSQLEAKWEKNSVSRISANSSRVRKRD